MARPFKAGFWTEKEWEQMRQHSEIGHPVAASASITSAATQFDPELVELIIWLPSF